MANITRYRGDFFGGITTAVVALPLALAFGVSSGAGALAGLYGAIFAGALAAVFGGTRVQITGPTGPMTVVMALVVIHFNGNLAAAFAVVVLAGFFQILFGKFGIGRYIKLVPQPVVSGFMSGIGIIIIILQLPPMLGLSAVDGSTLHILAAVPQMLTATNPRVLMIGLLVLAVMQLPPLFVVGPVIVWAFATQSTTAALIFLVYGGFVSFSDTFLKPLLLGRGLDVPMLVILLGAIGGMILDGFIGLFVGAVVLAVAYQLMMAWLEEDPDLGIISTVDAPVPAEGDA